MYLFHNGTILPYMHGTSLILIYRAIGKHTRDDTNQIILYVNKNFNVWTLLNFLGAIIEQRVPRFNNTGF